MLLGISIIVWLSSTSEGFQDVQNPQPSVPLISPRYQTLTKGEVQPFAPPNTTLLAPPPGQSASVNSQPASDPAMEKSNAGRIQSVYESMVGFFKTDAPGLQKIGDPSVQLPLSTARSDMGRLKDELGVLSRNPGLESSLTGEDVDSIEANLGYLQNKWRMSTNAMSGSPMPPTEGFQSGGSGSAYSSSGSGPAAGSGAPSSAMIAAAMAAGSGSGSGSRAAPIAPSPAMGSGSGSGSGTSTGGSDITLKDLQDLSLRINVEIVRLQSSGTTDLNTQSRINVLTSINQVVSDLIKEVVDGTRKLNDVPIKRADIAKFLPAMANLNTAIPELIKDSGMNTFLNNLFPKFSVGDISGSVLGKAMFDAYAKDFFNNLSWDVGFSYKGKAEQDIARNNASAAADSVAAATSGQDGAPTPGGGAVSAGQANAAPDSPYRGLMSSIVSSQMGVEPSYVSAGMGGAPNMATKAKAPGPPASLDWKERSKQICAQITARGMDPNDFGCLADPDKMRQESFSWRGYTRMVCDRLNTVYDTSVPFLCGCPPPTWAGWRQ
jgi:hypothetical protein